MRKGGGEANKVFRRAREPLSLTRLDGTYLSTSIQYEVQNGTVKGLTAYFTR